MRSPLRHRERRRLGVSLATALMSLGLAWPGQADAADQKAEADFVLGYASAVLQREFDLARSEVAFVDGVLWVRTDELDPLGRERLARALRIEAVEAVRVVTTSDASDGLPPVESAPPERGWRRIGRGPELTDEEDKGWTLFPREEVFTPLMADPRWPHFSAAYQRFFEDDELRHAAAVSFGETLALAGGPALFGGRADIALHAGVFSIFDLDSESFDLLNSDFLVGLAGSWRRDDFSFLMRIYHQSSHLGDELLLRERVDRVNLSFEAAELLISRDLPWGFRVYAGGSYLLRRDPSELDPWAAQTGLELRAPFTWLEGKLRPVMAVDLQSREETDWDLDLSARAGIQIERPSFLGQKLQVLLEYYDGHSPHGQFFERNVRYLGVGSHLHF